MAMKEDFLHYIWQYQKFTNQSLLTEQGKKLQVLGVGELNTDSGPDFYNAQLVLGDQRWAGTVEVHIKSSDWYVHKHHQDIAYNNVILHVVWEDDMPLFDVNNNPVETLVLKGKVSLKLLSVYANLLARKKRIPCEAQLQGVSTFTINFWKEKLLVQRLERKAQIIKEQCVSYKNDWEAVLFESLAENFGLKINAAPFGQLAKSISFKVFKKELRSTLAIEALLFGQANLLSKKIDDTYYSELQLEYKYLKQKHQLKTAPVVLQFFRLRPSSFPTIRLSQFASVYLLNKNLFSKIIEAKTVKDIQELFLVSASSYWNDHYVFGKTSAKRQKKISKSFLDLLIVNTIIPIKYMYAKSIGVDNFEELLMLFRAIKPEKNNITKTFRSLGVSIKNSADSQSLIELKTKYCNAHKCLQCAIGNKLLGKGAEQ